ncbi:MAG: YeeE/YedE thiosulfate transporter family protein [Chloroflexota bacterium]
MDTNKFLAWFRQVEWSPYLTGAMLGMLAIFTLLFTGLLFGASGAFENVAGAILQAAAPALADNTYWRFVMPAGMSWGVVMGIGLIIGAFIAAITSGDFKLRWISDEQWIKVFGPAHWKRWLALFAGGILLEYGAGLAGGCTSGLAISGGVQLAPAAFIFMAGMFISGIITAKILYGKRY